MSILHADLDAFYASVEQRDDPGLRGRPVLVGGGVVLAASYEAKAFGVRTPMSLSQARALCPQAIVVPPRMGAYSAASKAVFEVFHDTTPIVEGISIDEAFLEVGGLRRISGTPPEIAARLRAEVRDRVGLPITVGVAATKFLAKVASGVGKPDGLLVVPEGEELAFLHPLPIERLWGVGPVTAGKLRDRRIHTVGHVARIGEAALIAILGPGAGHHLHALAHNQDPRRVRVGQRRGSIGSQCALGRRPRPPSEISATLDALVDRVTRRMRAAGRPGRTVTLRLRFDDFGRATRSRSLLKATMQTDAVARVAHALLREAQPLIATRGLTLIGVAVGNLEGDGAVQLTLPFAMPSAAGPGASATSGRSGASAASGLSGTSATSGPSGASAASGLSGASAAPGRSGASAVSGPSGASAASVLSGASAASGLSGAFATSGPSGASTASGSSGAFAASGSSGGSAAWGSSGASAASGSSGASAASGSSGASAAWGSSGGSAASGLSGASAASGLSGASAPSGSSGESAASGSSGGSAAWGSSGASAASGSSGGSAPSGSSSGSAPSGSSGESAASGSSGGSAASGSTGGSFALDISGLSGFSGFNEQRADQLDAAMDAVRGRFGSGSLTRGASRGRDLHQSVPMLPD